MKILIFVLIFFISYVSSCLLEDGVLRLARFDLLDVTKLITAEIAEITATAGAAVHNRKMMPV